MLRQHVGRRKMLANIQPTFACWHGLRYLQHAGQHVGQHDRPTFECFEAILSFQIVVGCQRKPCQHVGSMLDVGSMLANMLARFAASFRSYCEITLIKVIPRCGDLTFVMRASSQLSQKGLVGRKKALCSSRLLWTLVGYLISG